MNGPILIVDDNGVNLKLAADVLQYEGYSVLTADNADEALAIVRERSPHLILMDISMPGTDGLSLTRVLKSDPDTVSIVIVALTASAMKGDEERILSAGCDGYIAKPIDTRKFAAQVASYLPRATSTDAPEVAGARYSTPHDSKTILIVDDHPTNRKLLRAILDGHGFAVAEASDGIEALEILEQQPIDAIVSDILMPRMDGYRLCIEVRKDPRFRGIPFIVYTSTYTSPGDAKLATDVGADRYITKPAGAATILEIIEESTVSSTRRSRPSPPGDLEVAVMKEYSQRLVAKLEERSAELTERNRELLNVERELRSTHLKLRQLLENSPAVIYALRIEGQSVFPYLVSENIAELLGFKVEETLRYEWWFGQLHPDDRDRAAASIADTLRDGSCRTEYRMRRRNGDYIWVEDNRRVVPGENGEPAEIVGVWTDVTERKKLEADVVVREQRLNAFFTGAAAGLALLDSDLRFVQINDTLAQMNGLTASDHIGMTVEEVVPDLAPHLVPILNNVLRTGEPVSNLGLSGTTGSQPGVQRHWVESLFPIVGKDGKPEGVGAIVVEITERQRAEEALRESETKFRQLAENIQDAFWIATPDFSEIVYVSPAYETIWGRTVSGLYQHPDEWMDGVLPQDRQHVIDTFANLTTGAPQVSAEYRVLRPDGTIVSVLDRGFPIRDENGAVYRIGGIAKDVTEHKVLEEGLRRTQKMEAIGQLAGGIAHDFNNILGCISGYAELACMKVSDRQIVEQSLHQVLNASQRATELVRQILTFTRQQEPERRLIFLQPVIREALQLLRASLPSTIDIQSNIVDDGPRVLADATQIHQVVMNLATNGAHAMNGRGRLLATYRVCDVDEQTVRTLPDLRVGRYARLTVEDTGCGMDAATMQRIFDPFFTTKGPGEGTGMGLAVVHGIVKSHEGAIAVESEPNQGTTFILYFPTSDSAVSDAIADNYAIPAGNGERVLFVDDEPALGFLGGTLLESAGYKVTIKTNPVEALALFREQPDQFDLLITDLTMPTLTGADLLREILKIRPDLPVVLVTGFAGSMTGEAAQSLGARELLLKPTTASTLAEAAHRALSRSKVEEV